MCTVPHFSCAPYPSSDCSLRSSLFAGQSNRSHEFDAGLIDTYHYPFHARRSKSVHPQGCMLFNDNAYESRFLSSIFWSNGPFDEPLQQYSNVTVNSVTWGTNVTAGMHSPFPAVYINIRGFWQVYRSSSSWTTVPGMAMGAHL